MSQEKTDWSMYRRRYNRTSHGHPYQTLVTREDNGMIYFGVSKCNLDAGDKPSKEYGLRLARLRADKALECSNKLTCTSKDFPVGERLRMSTDELMGKCKKEDIQDLLDWFSFTYPK